MVKGPDSCPFARRAASPSEPTASPCRTVRRLTVSRFPDRTVLFHTPPSTPPQIVKRGLSAFSPATRRRKNPGSVLHGRDEGPECLSGANEPDVEGDRSEEERERAEPAQYRADGDVQINSQLSDSSYTRHVPVSRL